MQKIIFLLFCFLALQFKNCYAQNRLSQDSINQLKKIYEGFDFIYLESNLDLSYTVSNEDVKITGNSYDKILVLTKQGAEYLKYQTFEFDNFIKLKTRTIKVTPLNGIKENAHLLPPEKKIADGIVFYNGEKSAAYYIKDLKIGDVIEQSYTTIQKSKYIPIRHFFSSNIPTLTSRVTIKHSKNIELNFHEFNFENTVEKTSKNSSLGTEITFQLNGKPKLYYKEQLSPTFLLFAKHIIINIGSIKSKNKTIKVLDDITGLEHLYLENISSVLTEQPTTDLSKLTHSITDSLETELDKVKAIYYWVQNNVKYIAFEEGNSGFIPRSGNNTVKKRYGDCKDMASLIYLMGKSISIPIQLTWVGTRDIPYTYLSTYNGYVDNHMIAVYRTKKEVYYLDATSSFQPISIPTNFIQGKEIFSYTNNKTFKIDTIPIVKSELNSILDSTVYSIKDNQLSGIKTLTATGYEKLAIEYEFGQNTREQSISYMKEHFFANPNEIEKLTLNPISLGNRDVKFEVNIPFEYSKNTFNNQLVLFYPFQLKTPFSKIDFDKRKNNIELENTIHLHNYIQIKIPENHTPKYNLKDTVFTSDGIEMNFKYSIIDNVIEIDFELSIDKIHFNQNQFKDLQSVNQFIESLCSNPFIFKQKK